MGVFLKGCCVSRPSQPLSRYLVTLQCIILLACHTLQASLSGLVFKVLLCLILWFSFIPPISFKLLIPLSPHHHLFRSPSPWGHFILLLLFLVSTSSLYSFPILPFSYQFLFLPFFCLSLSSSFLHYNLHLHFSQCTGWVGRRVKGQDYFLHCKTLIKTSRLVSSGHIFTPRQLSKTAKFINPKIYTPLNTKSSR